MHHPDFQKLEGTWRGLNYLVMNSETSEDLQDPRAERLEAELFKDLDKAVEFDQSQMFKKIYENEFGTPGGEPYGALIGDYEFTNHPEDIDLLRKMSQRGGGGVLPVHFGRQPEAVRLRQLHGALQAARPGEDLRQLEVHQVELVPRIGRLAVRHADDAAGAGSRLPYGSQTQADRGVQLRGSRAGRQAEAKPVPHEHYHLDERGLCARRTADRRLRQVRLVHRDPRRRGRRQGRRPAGPHLHQRRRRRGPASARPRSASPTAARPS